MTATIWYRTFWGVNKRQELLASLDEEGSTFSNHYAVLNPTPENLFSLRPGNATAGYSSWAGINELSRAADWSGVLEKRRGALMDHDDATLRERMGQYCDPAIPFAEIRARRIGPVLDAGRFDAARARRALIEAGGITAGRVARISLYPFDERWCFHSDVRPLWNEPRPELAAQQAAGNCFLVTRARARRPEEGFPCFATAALPGDHLLDPNAHPMPFVLHVAGQEGRGLGLELPRLRTFPLPRWPGAPVWAFWPAPRPRGWSGCTCSPFPTAPPGSKKTEMPFGKAGRVCLSLELSMFCSHRLCLERKSLSYWLQIRLCGVFPLELPGPNWRP